jgi:hypothetical protein
MCLLHQERSLRAREAIMPIRRYLQNSAVAFDSLHIEAMNLAFEAACRDLRLADRDQHDPLLSIVAEILIGFAKRGERDPIRLQNLVIATIRAA